MKTCNKCQVTIKDHTQTCPLCKTVLVGVDEPSDGLIYPEIAFKNSSYYLLNKIFLFISLLTIITSITVNYLLYNGVLWSIGSISAVLYIWATIRHAIRNSIDLASKIIVQSILASVMVIILDFVIGFSNWSVNYVVPQIVTLANIGILVLLIVSKLDWKRYVLHQLGMILLGFVPVLLLALGVVDRPLMTYISTGTATVIFLFTVVFGDKTLKSELIRRFHI